MKFLSLRSGSLAARLTLMLGAIVLAVFAASGIALDWALRRELVQEKQAELRGKAELVRHLVGEASRSGDSGRLKHALDDMLVGHDDLKLWITARDGRVVYASSALPKMVDEDRAWSTIVDGRGVPFAALRFPLNPFGGSSGVYGIVAIDTSAQHRLVAAHRLALASIFALGIALTAVLGAIATRRGLKPLAILAKEARTISPKHRAHRLTVTALHDELETIAGSFNQTLDRLEAAYRHMEGFNADVAHELRTPLATLIQSTHLALARPRSVAEMRNTLASNLEELEQMSGLVSDMLFLARADRGEGMLEVHPASLADEAVKVVDFFDAACEERGITVEIEGDAQVPCVASLVRRALSNLLSNALRHSPPDTAVRIRIRTTGAYARLAVENPGAAIAPEALSRMFDRFYVADVARATRGEGHGLGLAIVRAIAQMHGGDVFASSNDGWTRIGLNLPTA